MTKREQGVKRSMPDSYADKENGKENENKTSWTPQQERAIDLRHVSILVSAAAGSGKTAVLTERISRLICDPDNPVDVDKILIVTYTEAAALEMRDRIRSAIEKRLRENPDDENLVRQAALLHGAHISTIHSFCLTVIRENFHTIDLEPGFRVADEGELRLLSRDVMDQLLEHFYEEADPEFLQFVDRYAKGRKDERVESLIERMHEYALSHPQPQKWLRECISMYDEPNIQKMVDIGVDVARGQLEGIRVLLLQNMELAGAVNGPYMYEETARADVEMIDGVLSVKTFEHMREKLAAVSWNRLSGKKDGSVDEKSKERFKGNRDYVKKLVKQIETRFFYADRAQMICDMIACRASLVQLVRLVRMYDTMLSEEKRQRGVIDFHDMERFALQILVREENGVLVPTKAAYRYREQFVEVMIDEYQDSNLLQETILTAVSRIGSGCFNLFTVGDVKQSIYSFRLSRPELFMRRYTEYTLDEQSDEEGRQEDESIQVTDAEERRGKEREVRIDLHRNFRSRTEVLDTVNELFLSIMRKEVGDVEYDGAAMLRAGAAYPNDESRAYISELLLLTEEDIKEHDLSAREAQACLIARTIERLKRDVLIWDQKYGEYRTVQYGDIAILARGLKGWIPVLQEAMQEANIPMEAVGAQGYFSAYEVRLLLDVLRVLDNGCQDIALVGVMTSFFGGFSDEELARIRLWKADADAREKTGTSFYEQVLAARDMQRNSDEDDEGIQEREKITRFLNWLEQWREKAVYTPLHKLIWELVQTSGYDLYVRSMPGGMQRYANVRMLVEKAAEFERTSYRGLFQFVRYIERLEKYEIDFGQAQADERGQSGVRLMSIHKSKGLEFPIVIVAGMSDRFNQSDISDALLLHPKWGVGPECIDTVRRTKAPTILRRLMAHSMRTDQLGEEQRVLYVAMTRPMQKLIMTGVVTKSTLEDIQDTVDSYADSRLSIHEIQSARCYMDWIAASLRRGNRAHIQICPVMVKELRERLEIVDAADDMARKRLEDGLEESDPATLWQLDRERRFVYAHEHLAGKKRKYSVSELKKIGLKKGNNNIFLEPGDFGEVERYPVSPAAGRSTYTPSFVEQTCKTSATERGNAYHKVLELWPYETAPVHIQTCAPGTSMVPTAMPGGGDTKEMPEYVEQKVWCEHVRSVLDQMLRDGVMEEASLSLVREEAILGFLTSDLGVRMARAAQRKQLYREQPFVLGVDLDLRSVPRSAEDMVLVQGIIDAYFREDDGIILVDYKTDQVRDAQELVRRYAEQLEYYSSALERLTGDKVREKIIYSIALNEAVML